MSVLVEGSPADSLPEGSSVTLSCSSDANPPVHNYTWWYQRTGSPGSSSLLQVGSEQLLVLTSLQSSQSGLYFCHTRNSLGENNSTEVLLQIDVKGESLETLVKPLIISLCIVFSSLMFSYCT